ncbi:helix-hairpin-helix domain-containing protein [Opitutus sp. ER46]|uniref:helix-hairpin-helix domain-containing protein n=1 Tax=Opitutus sp. ER46 TaxID=2161864 RepID=UPI000D3143CA|nr:helix-hairpin-helix domain-containing protein [Opitutus sp. ER46]PTX94674.1 histidinol-phosphatase [Opitutus sp. ER46]
MTKNEIADVLSEIALLLELQGENPFKVRAYSTGARALEAIEESELARLIAEDRLQDVKGIGEALSKKIVELHATGKLAFYEKQKAAVEPGLVEMLQIPGLGPKKIRALKDRLGITTIAALTEACTDGRVAELDGFGAKTQEKIIAGIRNREAYGRRHLWWDAWTIAEPIVQGLRQLPQVKRAEAAGSLRRGMETVGDLDFIVAATEVGPVVEWFVALPGVKEVTAKGDTKASVRFESGLQADLRIVPDEQFVFALHHFTGSKDHNVQMRQRALARGLSLSEWGLTRVESEPAVAGAAAESKPPRKVTGPSTPSVVSPKDEGELFAALGLSYVPPELREGLGEIELAERGALPRLVEAAEIRGCFHNHTTASDGRNTLAEMTAAAEALGWEYLGIADHSKSSFVANGLNEERLLYQVKEIRALNASKRFTTRVFAGVECDILPDGQLDYDDVTLAQLDYVVASVHNVFSQDEATMTRRIIRAIEHPATMMLGHLTGRLLLRREAYRVEVEKVIDAAVAKGVIIELNANPSRLDLDWRHWRKAAARGLLCSINPDAHDTGSLRFVRAGLNAARKAGLTREQLLNTRPLADVQAYFEKRTAPLRARG